MKPARIKTGTKRVGMVAYTHYPFDGRVRLEAESLVRWGYEVFFLVPKEGPAPREYTLDGVRVIELNADEYGGKSKLRYLLSYLAFMSQAFIACTRLFFKQRVRVIHVHNMPDVLILSALIPRLFGCRLVLDLHDTVLETYQAKFGKGSPLLLFLLRVEERLCCAMAHQVICVNHIQREVVAARGVRAGKIATVITMPQFSCRPGAHRFLSKGSKFRMVNHGTMSKRLGNDLIIEAAAKLVHEIPGFELHMIGAGDNLDQLIFLAQSLGLENHVHFHEGVPWDQLALKLDLMDVGVVANRVNVATRLMLPSKLIDYVVLGIPAIVPRLEAIEYYFSEEMVSFFEPENVDSMIDATVRLYQDTGRRQRQPKCAKEFLHAHAWDNCRGGLRDIYESLLPQERAGSRVEGDKHRPVADISR